MISTENANRSDSEEGMASLYRNMPASLKDVLELGFKKISLDLI